VDGVIFITHGGTMGPMQEPARHDASVVVIDREVRRFLADLVLVDTGQAASWRGDILWVLTTGELLASLAPPPSSQVPIDSLGSERRC
jgi:hypothetical protein